MKPGGSTDCGHCDPVRCPSLVRGRAYKLSRKRRILARIPIGRAWPEITVAETGNPDDHPAAVPSVADVHITLKLEVCDLRHGAPSARGNVADWPIATFRCVAEFGRFSNRPFRVKHLQTIRRRSVDVSHGLALLFGIGIRALVWGFFSQEV